MRRVLVLRPQPGASATADRARARGLDPLVRPLFQVEPVAWQAPEQGRFDGLLLTSASGVRCGGDGLKALRGLPVYAVGAATAQVAREAGFDIAASGEAGVDRLLESIEPDLRLLHLAGEDRRAPQPARQPITVIPVYRAEAIDSVDLSGIEGSIALIHSPRAGRRLGELADQQAIDRSAVAIAAISAEAAEAAGAGWESADVASAPDDDALLALAERLCNNSRPT